MSATINTPVGEALCHEYHWYSECKPLEKLLNALLKPGGPGGEDPNPDLTAARAALDEVPGAELVHYDTLQRQEGVVY